MEFFLHRLFIWKPGKQPLNLKKRLHRLTSKAREMADIPQYPVLSQNTQFS